jgi:hypothetical protein
MYEFVTIWRFGAEAGSVWEAIKDSESWPEWWRGVLKVEKISDGDASGVGAVHRSCWRSVLPYTIRFDSEVVRIDESRSIEIRAFGELEGFGLWTLEAVSACVTSVRYDWRVVANKTWMRAAAPLLKPFFRWNHDVIMAWGGAGLARKLSCKLIENN